MDVSNVADPFYDALAALKMNINSDSPIRNLCLVTGLEELNAGFEEES